LFYTIFIAKEQEMKNFISSLLSDGGKISSKRLVTLLAFIMMSVGFIANLFWDFSIDRFIYESMQWIVMIGLGATASEKFSKYMNLKDAKGGSEEDGMSKDSNNV